jgi:hypothetical protein
VHLGSVDAGNEIATSPRTDSISAKSGIFGIGITLGIGGPKTQKTKKKSSSAMMRSLRRWIVPAGPMHQKMT